MRRCWLHTWGKWEKVNEGVQIVRDIDDPQAEERVIGYFLLQSRRCEACGQVQLRTART